MFLLETVQTTHHRLTLQSKLFFLHYQDGFEFALQWPVTLKVDQLTTIHLFQVKCVDIHFLWWGLILNLLRLSMTTEHCSTGPRFYHQCEYSLGLIIDWQYQANRLTPLLLWRSHLCISMTASSSSSPMYRPSPRCRQYPGYFLRTRYLNLNFMSLKYIHYHKG